MIILGIDTSGREGSVALVRADREGFETLGLEPIAGGTYSAQLIPVIARLLERAALPKSAVDLLAVVSGPGSFTGLRVGLSTVKGLAEALGKPIVAVSLLEAVAASSRQMGPVMAALDAQRNEVYAGEYGVLPGETVQCVEEVLLPAAEFTARLQSRHPALLTCTPDATVEQAVRQSGAPVLAVARPKADLIARLGMARYRRKQTVSPEALDANYIRRSDAEIFSAPKPAPRPE